MENKLVYVKKLCHCMALDLPEQEEMVQFRLFLLNNEFKITCRHAHKSVW